MRDVTLSLNMLHGKIEAKVGSAPGWAEPFRRYMRCVVFEISGVASIPSWPSEGGSDPRRARVNTSWETVVIPAIGYD